VLTAVGVVVALANWLFPRPASSKSSTALAPVQAPPPELSAGLTVTCSVYRAAGDKKHRVIVGVTNNTQRTYTIKLVTMRLKSSRGEVMFHMSQDIQVLKPERGKDTASWTARLDGLSEKLKKPDVQEIIEGPADVDAYITDSDNVKHWSQPEEYNTGVWLVDISP
jgi:hypothetical protein